jgi:hypothetical protein
MRKTVLKSPKSFISAPFAPGFFRLQTRIGQPLIAKTVAARQPSMDTTKFSLFGKKNKKAAFFVQKKRSRLTPVFFYGKSKNSFPAFTDRVYQNLQIHPFLRFVAKEANVLQQSHVKPHDPSPDQEEEDPATSETLEAPEFLG